MKYKLCAKYRAICLHSFVLFSLPVCVVWTNRLNIVNFVYTRCGHVSAVCDQCIRAWKRRPNHEKFHMTILLHSFDSFFFQLIHISCAHLWLNVEMHFIHSAFFFSSSSFSCAYDVCIEWCRLSLIKIEYSWRSLNLSIDFDVAAFRFDSYVCGSSLEYCIRALTIKRIK